MAGREASSLTPSSVPGLSKWLDGAVFWEKKPLQRREHTSVFNIWHLKYFWDIQTPMSRGIWILEKVNLVILLFLLLLSFQLTFLWLFPYQPLKRSQDFLSLQTKELWKNLTPHHISLAIAQPHWQISRSPCIHCFHCPTLVTPTLTSLYWSHLQQKNFAKCSHFIWLVSTFCACSFFEMQINMHNCLCNLMS